MSIDDNGFAVDSLGLFRENDRSAFLHGARSLVRREGQGEGEQDGQVPHETAPSTKTHMILKVANFPSFVEKVFLPSPLSTGERGASNWEARPCVPWRSSARSVTA